MNHSAIGVPPWLRKHPNGLQHGQLESLHRISIISRLIHSWNDATQISRSAGHCETFASAAAAAPNDESILVYLCLFPHSKCKCWETILQIKGFFWHSVSLSQVIPAASSHGAVLLCIKGATASLAISENCTIVALEGLVEGLRHFSSSASYSTAECIKQMVADNHRSKMK